MILGTQRLWRFFGFQKKAGNFIFNKHLKPAAAEHPDRQAYVIILQDDGPATNEATPVSGVALPCFYAPVRAVRAVNAGQNNP